MGSVENCLDGEALRGGHFLLWGEPGLRRGLGWVLFPRGCEGVSFEICRVG
jgi:hypothetical protein